jgi:hypothetical protein
MKNESWRGKKKTHEWDFMGHSKDGKIEYCSCQHCDKIGYWGDKPHDEKTFITWKEYDRRMNAGEIIID